MEGRRYESDTASLPTSIPFLALSAWILAVGWFGFNVMSAQTADKISGLVAINSLMAMVGGTLAAFVDANQVWTYRQIFIVDGPDRGFCIH